MLPLSSLPPIASGQQLGPGAVHLWCFFYEGHPLEPYDALINPLERERLSRLRFERDRQMFMAARALVRTVLSEYAPVAPECWQFSADPGGKPRVVGSVLEFGLSHTPGLVACVVSQHRVGVDVERIEPHSDLEALARRAFSPAEVAELLALEAEQRPVHFFQLWTRKESFLKARGLGLSAAGASTDDRSQDWSFVSLRGSAVHAIGIAAETRGLALSAACYVPLQGILPAQCDSPS